MSHSLSLATKGRIYTPESRASQGILYRAGVFRTLLEGLYNFYRTAVTRIFTEVQDTVFDKEPIT